MMPATPALALYEAALWRFAYTERRMSLSAAATDTEIVALARRGQRDALELLIARHSPRLFRYLRRLVSDTALAEDLLQDAWLRVVERLDAYDAAQPFVIWLFAIARHRAIDAYRQRAREGRLLGRRAEAWENEEGEEVEPLERVAAAGPSPLARLEETALAERVAAAFARLPRHYREALALRFQEDLRFEEIAQVLSLPLSTVKTRVQRGLEQLRARAEGLGLAP